MASAAPRSIRPIGGREPGQVPATFSSAGKNLSLHVAELLPPIPACRPPCAPPTMTGTLGKFSARCKPGLPKRESEGTTHNRCRAKNHYAPERACRLPLRRGDDPSRPSDQARLPLEPSVVGAPSQWGATGHSRHRPKKNIPDGREDGTSPWIQVMQVGSIRAMCWERENAHSARAGCC